MTNEQYLRLLSDLGKTTISKHLRELSSLTGIAPKTRYLSDITGLPYGLEQIDYYKEWSGLSGNVTINDCLKELTGIPLPDELQQHINGFESVFNFDATNYITVTKTQTINSEWQCLYRAVIPVFTDPDTINETLYRMNTTSVGDLKIVTGNLVRFAGNGVFFSNTTPIDLSTSNTIELFAKSDAVRIVVNEVSQEISATFTEQTWDSYEVGRGSVFLTCLLSSWTDCDGIVYTPSNVGDYPYITVTDPNNTLFDLLYGEDESGNNNYALQQTADGKISLNNSGNTVTGVANYPAEGVFLSLEELDASVHDPDGIFTENPDRIPSKDRILTYYDSVIMTEAQQTKALKYVGRTELPPLGDNVVDGTDNVVDGTDNVIDGDL